MSESELLSEFLRHWPESYHPADEKRFVAWAIAAHRSGRCFPLAEFQAKLTERAVDYYHNAFLIVGYTLEMI